jgi:hypothetical protein
MRPVEINVEELHRNRNRAMPEDELQAEIVKAAGYAGFDLIYHTYDSRRSEPGFPDLVMLHRSGRMVVVECKREGKHPTVDQQNWLAGFERLREYAMQDAIAVYVARPSNRQDIIDALAQYAGLE